MITIYFVSFVYIDVIGRDSPKQFRVCHVVRGGPRRTVHRLRSEVEGALHLEHDTTTPPFHVSGSPAGYLWSAAALLPEGLLVINSCHTKPLPNAVETL